MNIQRPLYHQCDACGSRQLITGDDLATITSHRRQELMQLLTQDQEPSQTRGNLTFDVEGEGGDKRIRVTRRVGNVEVK